MALNKEIWVYQIQKNYYPQYLFLTYARDFTSSVEYDKIHIPEMGVDPDVLINNTTYPISTAERIDNDIVITLDLFETENTTVRDAGITELSYDKVDNVVYGHKQSLLTSTAAKAAHGFAPNSHTSTTPVLLTTGDDNGEGFKRMRPQDILKLKKQFDLADIPQEDRYLVLDPNHVEDLIEYDMKAFKDVVEFKNGEPNKFAGFNILQFSRNPKYNSTTKVKIAFDSVTPGSFSSFAFQKEEVMKADGSFKMFANVDDAKERATILGFQKRFIGLKIRNKGVGAIIAAPVA